MEILATETEMIGLEGDVGEDRMERRGGGGGDRNRQRVQRRQDL